MPLPTAPDEYVDVDGYGLYEWIEVDWTPLLDGADLKGDDTHIPGAVGDYVNPRDIAGTTFVCNGNLFGHMAFDGTPATSDADQRATLRQNLAFLRGFICADVYPNDPRRTLTVHGDPDWGADVIIDRHLSLAKESPFCFSIILRIKVPDGELVTVGS